MGIISKLFIGFDFIFYVIFSYYYNNGKTNKRNYPPIGQTYFIMVILFGALFMLLYILIDQITHLSKNPTFKTYFTKALAVFTMMCVYFLFIFKRRYIYVYNKYKSQEFANSKNGKRLGWLLYFIGLMSPIILSYIIFKIKY